MILKVISMLCIEQFESFRTHFEIYMYLHLFTYKTYEIHKLYININIVWSYTSYKTAISVLLFNNCFK